MKGIRSIFIFLSGFIVAAVLVELLLSYGGILDPSVRIDKSNGERYYPNKMCCSLFVGEGFGLAKTNSAGWFGKDVVHKPSDISVAVIGNSFVASRQVFYRDNFLTVAELETNKNLSRTHSSAEHLRGASASYYNFGKEAMPLPEALYIKEQIDSTYHPDYFLILINRYSFITTNRLVPYYELKGDSLCLNLSFKESSLINFYAKFPFVSESSLFFLVYRVKNKLPDLWQILLDKFYIPTQEATATTPTTAAQVSTAQESIDPTDKVIIEKLAKDKRVVFLLDLDYDQRIIVQSFITQSSFIDLKPCLRKLMNEQGLDPYFWTVDNMEGHWNIPAHKVIGEEIAKNMDALVKAR